MLISEDTIDLNSNTNNFAFEVKVIIGFECTRPDGLVNQICLNGSND